MLMLMILILKNYGKRLLLIVVIKNVFFCLADWMQRKLDNRIEVITPIYEQYIKDEKRSRIVDEKRTNKILNPKDDFRF
ncbi:MAG: hypothetical protein IMY72_04310 [Bacteroidetes bacterium]|nr:hypothetical protein [Bacteroidota bacterium]